MKRMLIDGKFIRRAIVDRCRRFVDFARNPGRCLRRTWANCRRADDDAACSKRELVAWLLRPPLDWPSCDPRRGRLWPAYRSQDT